MELEGSWAGSPETWGCWLASHVGQISSSLTLLFLNCKLRRLGYISVSGGGGAGPPTRHFLEMCGDIFSDHNDWGYFLASSSGVKDTRCIPMQSTASLDKEFSCYLCDFQMPHRIFTWWKYWWINPYDPSNELNLQTNSVLHVKAKLFCMVLIPIEFYRNAITRRIDGGFVFLRIIVHQFRKAHNQWQCGICVEWPVWPTYIILIWLKKLYIYVTIQWSGFIWWCEIHRNYNIPT